MDEAIRSRKPIHRSPTGSPMASTRREIRQISPDFSSSDNECSPATPLRQLCENDSDIETSSSSANSSLDSPDGLKVKITRQEHVKMKFDNKGRLREHSVARNFCKETIKLPKAPINKIWMWFAVVVAAIVACVLFALSNSSPQMERVRIVCSFDGYHKHFPNQDEMLWKSLKSGVEHVLNDVPTSPSIFLLAYQDVTSANSITRRIVTKTTECMESNVKPVELSSDDLKSKEMKSDYGIVIAKYRKQLASSGVMLVNDLNKVPFEVAQAFHSFCDVENPLVHRSIIFLTLQLDRPIHSNAYKENLQIVENYLRSNWSGLDSHILDPLVTRVTEQVFFLNKE